MIQCEMILRRSYLVDELSNDSRLSASFTHRLLNANMQPTQSGRLHGSLSLLEIAYLAIGCASEIEVDDISCAPARSRMSLALSTSSPVVAWTEMRMLPSAILFS